MHVFSGYTDACGKAPDYERGPGSDCPTLGHDGLRAYSSQCAMSLQSR